MFAEPEFWVALGFVIFVGIVWKVGGFKSLVDGLDTRGDRIRKELEEAKRLREEAATLLADFQRKAAEAEKEAAEIIAAAKSEAERVAAEAESRLNDFVARRTASAEAKIAQAEVQATAEVRSAAAEAGLRAAEAILREQAAGSVGAELLAKGVAEVKAKLN
jgi:F-type H+-transporting ATPase subunit b